MLIAYSNNIMNVQVEIEYQIYFFYFWLLNAISMEF